MKFEKQQIINSMFTKFRLKTLKLLHFHWMDVHLKSLPLLCDLEVSSHKSYRPSRKLLVHYLHLMKLQSCYHKSISHHKDSSRFNDFLKILSRFLFFLCRTSKFLIHWWKQIWNHLQSKHKVLKLEHWNFEWAFVPFGYRIFSDSHREMKWLFVQL